MSCLSILSAKRSLVIGLLALGLAGCFRPLYGSQEFGGLAVQRGLSGIKIELDGERLAHYLRNELEFGLRGGDPTVAVTTHRLVIRADQKTSAVIVDRIQGTAESGYMTLTAKYTLFPVNAPKAETEGDATVVVSYDRSQQRFATLRAARDAEIQGARQLADQIKTRVAGYLASKR
jgi:LPS-assembly lipoprotein